MSTKARSGIRGTNVGMQQTIRNSRMAGTSFGMGRYGRPSRSPNITGRF